VLANKAFATLWVLALGVLIAITFDVVLRSLRAFLIDYVARRLDLNVSSRLIERILNTRLENCAASTGLVTQRLHEYEFVREFATSNTLVFFIDLLFTFVFLLVIFTISPYLVLVPLVAMAMMIVIGFIVQRMMGKALAQADYTSAHRQSLMVEIVSSLETIKSVRAEGVMLRRWEIVRAIRRRPPTPPISFSSLSPSQRLSSASMPSMPAPSRSAASSRRRCWRAGRCRRLARSRSCSRARNRRYPPSAPSAA
jgi:ATP-binding cassette subfamily C protein LapB